MENTSNQTCLSCGKTVMGRADKRFCDDTCRNNYHNKQKADDQVHVRPINAILRKNRSILQQLNPTGKTNVHADTLRKAGFKFDYHTHHLTTQKGSTYVFCYEHGYLPLDNDWYMLVVNKR